MDALKTTVTDWADRHANADGLALTPVPGLRMMRARAAGQELHSIYRPLVCFVLQGAKHMTVGVQAQLFTAGQSVIVAADMPVAGRIVEADAATPYLAVAVEIQASLLQDLSPGTAPAPNERPDYRTLFHQETDEASLDCVRRLIALLDQPAAAAAIAPSILRELHYWLLAGRHGAALRKLAVPEGHAARLALAIALLRRDFRTRIPVEHLASTAGMSQTAFHAHFKRLTSLTPGQFQKRLRLIEARRLMQDEGLAAGGAAFAVGYESASHFTRDYGRMFGRPPRQDTRRARGVLPTASPSTRLAPTGARPG